MDDFHDQLDDELRRMYSRHTASPAEIDAVMERLADASIPAPRTRLPRWLAASGIGAVAAAAMAIAIMIAMAFSRNGDRTSNGAPDGRAIAQAKEDQAAESEAPANGGSLDPTVSSTSTPPTIDGSSEQPPDRDSVAPGQGSIGPPARSAPSQRATVVLGEKAENEAKITSGESSGIAVLPKRDADLIFVGTLGRLRKTATGDVMRLRIDRVLKGPKIKGRIVTPDELPYFDCSTAAPQLRRASKGFETGDEVVVYLFGRGSKWVLSRDLERVTPRFRALEAAAQSEKPAERLLPLVSVDEGGFDEDACLMVDVVLAPEQATPLLMAVLDAVPNALRDADDEARQRIVDSQLVPTCWMLGERYEPRMLGPVLRSLALLDEERWRRARGDIYYPLGIMLRVLVVGGRAEELNAEDVAALQSIINEQLRAPPAPVPDADAARGISPLLPADVATALTSLWPVFDGETTTVLLDQQQRRPVTRMQAAAARALISTFALAPSPLEHTPWIGDDDLRRMRAAWLEMLLSFKPTRDEWSHEWRFIDAVVEGIYRLSRKKWPLTAEESARLRRYRDAQQPGWFHDAFERLTRDPPPDR